MSNDYLPTEEEIAASQPGRRNSRVRSHDGLPPHSLEAEQGVLGCILLSPDEAMDLCADKLAQAGAAAFYDLRHQTLFALLRDMWESRAAVDLITVQSRLKECGKLEAIGGLTYLSSLQDAVPSAAHIEHYLEILIEKFALRNLIEFGQRVLTSAREDAGDVPGLVAQMQTEALALTDSHIKVHSRPASKIFPEILTALEKAKNGRQEITGLRTGLHYFDNMTLGLQAGPGQGYCRDSGPQDEPVRIYFCLYRRHRRSVGGSGHSQFGGGEGPRGRPTGRD